jgi:hypothetical protein
LETKRRNLVVALRMIDFECNECKYIFEELVEAKDGISSDMECLKCGHWASMIMDVNVRVHRNGNRYRDVSWSTWSIG